MKTVNLPEYHRLLANGILWACDKLDKNGEPLKGYGPTALLAPDAVWTMRYDGKLDGQVDKDAGKVRWRMVVNNNRVTGSLADMKADDPKNHRLVGEVVAGDPPILQLRQDGPGGLVCYYTCKRVAEGRIVGTWFDNRGGSGDFEFVAEK